MSFLVVHPDGSESNFATMREVMADQHARCPGHQFGPVPEGATVMASATIDTDDFEGCSLCGKMRRTVKEVTK